MNETESGHAGNDRPIMRGRAEFTPELMTRGWIVHLGWRGPVMRLIIFLFACSFLVFGLIFLWSNDFVSAVAILGCSLILFYYSVLGVYRVRRAFEKQFRQMGKDKEVVHYEPSDEHLHLKTEEVDLRLKWSELHKWKERDNLILAYRHERLYQLIPVNQLPRDVVDEIRRQLAEHVTKA